MSQRKMIVFGGNGFIGTRVAQTALQHGWRVVVACRSGVPQVSEPWTRDVEYASIDALERRDVYKFLDTHPDAHSVVSCIGLLSLDKRAARRVNGDPTINIAAAAHERPSIEKVAFISAAVMKPADKLLDAYYYGKQQAEKALIEHLPNRHVILRPGMVHGMRNSGGISIPTALVGVPMELLFTPLHALTGLSMFTPPVSVDIVARAVVEGCTDPAVHGVFEVSDIKRLAKRLL